MKHFHQKNVFQIHVTLFDKEDWIQIENMIEQTAFKNLAMFDYEYIIVPEESFRRTDTPKQIRKKFFLHSVPLVFSVSRSSNSFDFANLISDPDNLID